MNISLEKNLDYLAAKHAQQLINDTSADAKEIEKIITTTLGVLQENGVYACFLYLLASEKKKGNEVIAKMLALLQELQFPAPPEGAANNEAVLQYVAEKVAADLHCLLLAKEALEQMLIYARYGAKAAGKQ